MFYVAFVEGLVIFINSPVSAMFSVNVTSTVRGIDLPQHRHTMQKSRMLASFDFLKKEKGYDEDLTAGGRLGIFLGSGLLDVPFLIGQFWRFIHLSHSLVAAFRTRVF